MILKAHVVIPTNNRSMNTIPLKTLSNCRDNLSTNKIHVLFMSTPMSVLMAKKGLERETVQVATKHFFRDRCILMKYQFVEQPSSKSVLFDLPKCHKVLRKKRRRNLFILELHETFFIAYFIPLLGRGISFISPKSFQTFFSCASASNQSQWFKNIIK